MENPRKLTTNYILSKLYEKEVFYFSGKMYADIFDVSREKAYQSIFSLKQKELVKEMEA